MTRAAMVSALRARLVTDGFPRLTMLVIVSIAGGAAFLFSAIALWAGLHSMAVRYGLAAIAGYLAFGTLVRFWIAWQRDRFKSLLDLPSLDLGGGKPASAEPALFMGGRSGGGGAFGAVIAVGLVVYSAPVLLAEVALDAGLMSGVYRSIRKQSVEPWVGAVWRRTWIPAVIVVVCVAAAGYALQLAAPEARSIGGVLRAVTD